MTIGIPKETYPGENRCSLTPTDASKLVKKGARVIIESGAGLGARHSDDAYVKAGAEIKQDRKTLFGESDLLLRVRKPAIEEVDLLKSGAIHISYLDPFNERNLLQKLAEKNVSAVCMEMIPRTTRAQKMDVLSSQASLAGYAAVILAAERLDQIFPMMMTPAGTINPVRVFVIGAGVAGLQAIATAKRLGARVDAFDTRPVVAEQVKSLGGRFLEIDLGETGQTKDGYARELTPEQLQKQREAMAKQCSLSQVVITTAQVFGRKSPIIITRDMIDRMQPGSLVVDLAIEGGGNVEGAQLGKEVDVNGVRILGLENMPGRVAIPASQMYSSNVSAFIDEFWDKEAKTVALKLDDDIIQSALLTHGGQIINETIKKHFAK